MIGALLGSSAVFCLLGIVYVGAYMNVAYQGRQIHNLQAEITAETAKQHALVNEIGWKESPGRIAKKAADLGMVMGGKAKYFTVQNSNIHEASNPNSQAVAESNDKIGAGVLGDN